MQESRCHILLVWHFFLGADSRYHSNLFCLVTWSAKLVILSAVEGRGAFRKTKKDFPFKCKAFIEHQLNL